MRDATIIVTGGAGFIGSAVVRRLIRETEASVVNVDKLTYAGNLETLVEVERHPRHVFEHHDICDSSQMRRIFAEHGPQGVIHLAAESHVDRSIDGPGEFIETNVVGTFTLLKEAQAYWSGLDTEARAAFRFVHVSTDEVFGSLGPEGLFSEGSPYRPNSPYSASKAGGDHLVRAWFKTYGLPVVLTHSCNNYGPYQYPEKLIPLIITRGLAGETLPVYGAGANVRDWIFVEDHAAALVTVLAGGRAGDRYLIGAGAERTNLETVRTICRVLDELCPEPTSGPRDSLIRFVEDRPGHDHRYAIDPTKLREELGWNPTETFETGLRKTVEWYLENRGWCARAREGVYRGERLGLGVKA